MLQGILLCIVLNRANKVLGYQLISIGGITGTVVDPKCIYQEALKASAVNLILSHNHPSGNTLNNFYSVLMFLVGGQIVLNLLPFHY